MSDFFAEGEPPRRTMREVVQARKHFDQGTAGWYDLRILVDAYNDSSIPLPPDTDPHHNEPPGTGERGT